MIKKILKAKHWHLFILTFGIPMIFQIAIMVFILANIGRGNNPDPLVMFGYFKFFPIIIILYMGTQFSWLWSVAIGLQSKVPEKMKMKVKKFKIFFFIPVVYLVSICILISIAIDGLMKSGQEPNFALIISLVAVIIPLHLFSIFCIFYSLYFVAKTFKTVELQREVNFSDFAGEFFMIWFYPIGVWIIQPKINTMVE